MTAPNKQPSGSKPGHAAVNTHAPYSAGSGGGKGAPKASHSGETNVAKHGAPKPVGNGKKNPLR
jgi:hypothetical protein